VALDAEHPLWAQAENYPEPLRCHCRERQGILTIWATLPFVHGKGNPPQTDSFEVCARGSPSICAQVAELGAILPTTEHREQSEKSGQDCWAARPSMESLALLVLAGLSGGSEPAHQNIASANQMPTFSKPPSRRNLSRPQEKTAYRTRS
jgi:hypothetical protein